jgi:histidyl-tRNA synthetase
MVSKRARLESGEHIFYNILKNQYKTVQKALQIGDDKIRIVMECKQNLKDVPFQEFEDKVNNIIKKNLLVSKTHMNRIKADSLVNLSMVPKDVDNVRVVEIKGFDIQACGNPHVDNTAEIGIFKILKIEKKGKDTYSITSTILDKESEPIKMKKEKFKIDLAKGTRDFPPEEKILRDYVLNTVKKVCESYGFSPIETPILERYETLAAKFAAGEESDALTEIFVTTDNGNRKLGLRFDMTVPFSRFIAMNPNMKMPFKKYLTGEVFRDGPIKKGRYRSFRQFDPDIVGVKGMIADAEILAVTNAVFSELGFKFVIEINNRKIIEGALEDAGLQKKDWERVTISIDKLKKIGKSGVVKELSGKGFDKKVISKILDILKHEKTNKLTLTKLKKNIKSKIGREGLDEMEELLGYLDIYKVKTSIFDPSLARGLAYYTGPIYEVLLTDSTITSSAAGGGRYDELIGNYLGTKEQIPATGISFGIEVIIEALKEKGKATKKTVTQVFVIPIKTMNESLKIVKELRDVGINTDVDLLGRGISKNLAYANSYEIPYVLFIGQKELESGRLTLRDMKSGKEEKLSVKEIVKKFY